MAIPPQIEAIISHVLSQFIYQWLPLPYADPFDTTRIDEHRLSLRDWLAFIEEGMANLSRAWVQVMRRKRISLIGIATLIYDNLAIARDHQAVMLDFYHPLYPYLLRHIPDPPNCLMLLGTSDLLARPKIAIVGSRKATPFAFREAQSLGLEIARRGEVVVSGGAIGCDAAAHAGCLQASLSPTPTIVVFAGGLSKLHPRCLSELFTKLRSTGALFVSERLWDYPARPMDFPVRNRIIAGLSTRVLVMQAAERSGAIHTATYALDQGRDVYVLVHGMDDIRAFGSRSLLEQGANPFLSSEDFLSVPGLQS